MDLEVAGTAGKVEDPDTPIVNEAADNELSHSDRPAMPAWRLAILTTSLCIGLFLSLLDTTVVATALYTIGAEFHALNTVTWVALAYTLSYLSCVVPFARLADIIGRRNASIIAFVLFGAFSIGCGFAQSVEALIGFRVLQGIGGSGLYSLAIIILPEIFPQHLAKYMGSIIGIVLATSGVLGPLVGGAITYQANWRWIFWINPIIGIGPSLVIWFAWPKNNVIIHMEQSSFRSFDWISCLLLTVASVLVTFAFQESGITPNSWTSALFLAPLIIGVLSWLALLAWEWAVDRFWSSLLSMLPLRLLRRRIYHAAALVTLFTGYPYFLIIFNLPLRFQVVNSMSSLSAGIGLLPLVGSSAVGSMAAGRMLAGKNISFHIMLAGTCLMVIGTALLSTLSDSESTEKKVYGFQVFIGLGFGLLISTSTFIAAIESDLRDHAVAQGIIAQSRVLGGSIGIAASTAILGVVKSAELTEILTESQLTSLQSSESNLTLSQLLALRQAFSDSFNENMRVCAIIAGVCVLLSLGTFQRNPLGIPSRRKEQEVHHEQWLRRKHEDPNRSVES